MVKLADTLDLGSNAKSVQVQVLSSVPINQKRTSLVRFFAFLARITGLVAIEDYQQTTFATCTACSWRDWCIAHQSLLRSQARYKSCHPYQRCDANCCIAFFVSRNRNYVASLVGSSAALGFLKCYALDSPSACGHPYQVWWSASFFL